jgi:CubicO group peptidase (beta-lactamase class C family)
MRGHPSPIFEALRLYPRLIFVAAGAFVSTNLAFYILITYVVAYGTSAAVYGYMWYTRAEPVGRRHIEVHFASGNGGNKIYIVPSLRLVVAITSSAYNTTYGQRRSQEILWKILTAASRQTNSQDGRRLTGK